MIKVISFDIGGTLIKSIDSKFSIDILCKLTNKDHDDIKYAYRDIYQKRVGTFDELLDLFCERLNIKKTDELYKFFMDNFTQEVSFNEESIKVIKKIKELGYKVILFSNNSILYQDRLGNELKELVDEIFYSYMMGHTKDESESYRFIENKLGYQSYEFLHIGDSIKNDYLYPKENGWNALVYGKDIISLNDIFKYLDKTS